MKIMILNTAGYECIGGILDTAADKFLERRYNEKNTHAESLFSIIDSMLLCSELTFKDISDVAVIVGPGSFTGLRVALSAAQGLRLASHVSVHAITFLELNAYLISKNYSECDRHNMVSIVETHREHLVCHQAFSGELLPLSSIGFESRESIIVDNNKHNMQSICSLSKDTRSIGEYLVYKLSHKLPETPLLPIYSRFYN